MSKVLVAAAGCFDPLHPGHLAYLQAAKGMGDRLVVILIPDRFVIRKKGYLFLPFDARRVILEALRPVDEVIEAIDNDGTVARTLEMLRPSIYAQGGDRTLDNIPSNEVEACRRIGCRIVCGCGGTKTYSSSDLVRAACPKSC